VRNFRILFKHTKPKHNSRDKECKRRMIYVHFSKVRTAHYTVKWTHLFLNGYKPLV